MQKIHTIILVKRGFVKAFLHIFSFVFPSPGIFCISVKTHEAHRNFLVKIAYKNAHTRQKSPSFPGRAEIWGDHLSRGSHPKIRRQNRSVNASLAEKSMAAE